MVLQLQRAGLYDMVGSEFGNNYEESHFEIVVLEDRDGVEQETTIVSETCFWVDDLRRVLSLVQALQPSQVERVVAVSVILNYSEPDYQDTDLVQSIGNHLLRSLLGLIPTWKFVKRLHLQTDVFDLLDDYLREAIFDNLLIPTALPAVEELFVFLRQYMPTQSPQTLQHFPNLKCAGLGLPEFSEGKRDLLSDLLACPKLNSIYLRIIPNSHYVNMRPALREDDIEALCQLATKPGVRSFSINSFQALPRLGVESLLQSLQSAPPTLTKLCIFPFKEYYYQYKHTLREGLGTVQRDIVLEMIRSNTINTLEKLVVPFHGYDLVRLAEAMQYNNHLKIVDVRTYEGNLGIAIDDLDESTWNSVVEGKTPKEVRELWFERSSEKLRKALEAIHEMLVVHNTTLLQFECDIPDERYSFEKYGRVCGFLIGSFAHHKCVDDPKFLECWALYWPKIELLIGMNRAGRGILLPHNNVGSHKKWWTIIFANRHDIDSVYYFLSKNPALLGAKNTRSFSKSKGEDDAQKAFAADISQLEQFLAIYRDVDTPCEVCTRALMDYRKAVGLDVLSAYDH